VVALRRFRQSAQPKPNDASTQSGQRLKANPPDEGDLKRILDEVRLGLKNEETRLQPRLRFPGSSADDIGASIGGRRRITASRRLDETMGTCLFAVRAATAPRVSSNICWTD
jgi:hypothetical protein